MRKISINNFTGRQCTLRKGNSSASSLYDNDIVPQEYYKELTWLDLNPLDQVLPDEEQVLGEKN